MKLTPVAPPQAGTSELIVSIVHTTALVIAVATVAVAGKATDIAIRIHNSKRDSIVRPDLISGGEQTLRRSAGAGMRAPTCLNSESSGVSEPAFPPPPPS